MWVELFNGRNQIDPIGIGETDIANGDVYFLPTEQFQPLRTGFGLVHGKPLQTNDACQQLADVVFVVDNEDGGVGHTLADGRKLG